MSTIPQILGVKTCTIPKMYRGKIYTERKIGRSEKYSERKICFMSERVPRRAKPPYDRSSTLQATKKK